jgi:hypothetical protein
MKLSFISACSVLLAMAGTLAGCSMLNREGPNVTCADLAGGDLNACSDGIIAECADGTTVTYRACTEAVDDVAAVDVCGATWQRQGAFACDAAARLDVGPVSIEDRDPYGEYGDYGDGDGHLRAGDKAIATVMARNSGRLDIEALRPHVVKLDSDAVENLSCSFVGASGGTYQCGPGCECRSPEVMGGYSGTLAAGTTRPVLRVTFSLRENARAGPISMLVTLAAKGDATWTDTLTIEVAE